MKRPKLNPKVPKGSAKPGPVTKGAFSRSGTLLGMFVAETALMMKNHPH